ncbi:MAG: sensor histidine kinase [Thermodesulfobacteriota bacterium]
MRVGRFRGLRYEILGNLAVVSLISLLLTGFGVWFINGRHMLQQQLLQGRLLVQSFAEETLELLPADETGVTLDDPGTRAAVHDLMETYRKKDSRIQLQLVGPDLRVLASTGVGTSDATPGKEALRASFRTGEPCTRLDGKSPLFGSFHQATFAFPLRRSGEPAGGILATLSLDGVLGSARQTVKFILIYMTLGSLVFLIFGTILISRTLVQPLENTICVMQRVADGDLQQKVEPTGDNEVGRLARTFNTMAEKLKGHEKALNEHVKSLQKMNLELKQTQQEVIQSEKLASMGLLAAGIAHEIGNPLGAVLGYITMLEQGVADPQEQEDYLKRMEKELLRIDGIVRDLREYSRPSPRKIAPTDLNGIVRDTVSMLKRQRDFRAIRFELSLQQPLHRVSVDPGQVQQVLVNLFLNAKDAMHCKGALRVITRTTRYASPKVNGAAGPARREEDPPGIDYRLLRRTNPARKWPFLEDQGIVEIDVVDTGPGIPEEDLPRVFDPFFTTKEAGRGTGLGLSVSQRIIESFYGEIQITSEPNQGTRVRIRIPVLEEDEDTLRTRTTEEMLQDGTKAAHRG